uniref:alanine--tRNA ligase n=1 Tax=Kryptolebias marmoratus TaxID=37003 RepID=A0A3Q3AEM3_KRYMA
MLRLPFRRLRPLSAASGRSFSGLPPPLPAAQVRSTFLDFFRDKHGHLLVPSSPVRPRGDPSLLFVNAGMNQFKPIFLGTADPRSEMASYHRVVNSQKCVRAGGKHNDLEDVGRDGYHHTFFEMLGNWSFGDYFKVGGALYCTWSRPTGEGDPRHLVLVLGTLTTSVLLRVPPARVLPFGLKDNFWEMGDTGPCGPCTEIHYDHVGGRDARTLVNMDSPDVVEIWNLVFIQYNREVDQSLRLLPRFSVDTGMGLERLTGVLQGRRSNYDTDLFTPLLHAIQQVRAGPYAGRTGTADEGQVDLAYRVVADHIRTLSVFSVQSAGTCVMRILRRAVRFCIEVLKAPQGALASLVPTVTYICLHVVPALQIMDIINENEAHFLSSLRQGSRLLQRTLSRRDYRDRLFPASVAWSLHRDLGFPLDLVDLMLAERGVQVDRQELDRLIAENQRALIQQAGVSSRLMLDVLSLAALQRVGVPHTDDSLKYAYRLEDGRYVFPACHATVLALFDGQALVPEVREGQSCGVILDRTCFYSEQGGQSHDRGYFTCSCLQDVLFPVEAVHRAGGYVVHQVTAVDSLKTGDQIQLHLDQAHRMSCMVKHTATHILNFALRKVLGSAVSQRGSHLLLVLMCPVGPSQGSLSSSQLQQVERCVNDIISANQIVHSQEVPLQTARTIRGLRTVDEVSPDCVSRPCPAAGNGDRQRDVCGALHLLQTGAIKDLVIVSEKQLVKGISRIIAVTGQMAPQLCPQARESGHGLWQEVESLSARLSSSTPSSPDSAQRLSKEANLGCWQRRELQGRLRGLLRANNTVIRKLETREAAERAQVLLEKNGRKEVLVDFVETESLSVRVQFLLISGLRHSGKILCACQVPKDSPALAASDWAVALCQHLGGSAGGSALVAQGTGSSSDITEALRWAEDFACQKTQR